MMCPYEVPQYSSSLGIVRKCDMCSQRLGIGEAPACVQACPNQAIRIAIVDVATVIANTTLTKATASLVSTAPPNRITMPTTKYISMQTSAATAHLLSNESIEDKAHEGHLPLVAMIVLTQASVGMWFVLAMLGLATESSSRLFAAAFATTLGFIGVHAALLHLGRPWLAFRAFLGWRTSWLSREAIAFGLFVGAAMAATGLRLVLPQQAVVHGLAEVFVAATGVAAVTCTGMIYIATRRELWGHFRTGVDFGLSMMGLGLIGAFACVEGLPNFLLVFGVLCSILAATAKLVDYKRGKSAKVLWDDFSARSGRVLRTELAIPWRVLWILHVIALIASVLFFRIEFGITKPYLSCSILVVSLAAQAVHRWLYFASIAYRRMPGAST